MARVLTVTLNPALDRIVRGKKDEIFPGGKGVNVTRALQAMGVESVPFVAVAGMNGQRLLQGLKAEGFRPAVFEVAGETRVNTTVIRKTGAPRRTFGAGPVWRRSDVKRLRDMLGRLIRARTIVVLSGSLPVGAPEDLYRELVSLSSRRGARVFLDAHGPALQKALRAVPLAVKPNRPEAEELLGFSVSNRRALKKALQSLACRGMKKVLLTLASRGLAGTDGREFFLVHGPRFPGHGVGCGDAAMAGFVLGTIRRKSLGEQLCLAAACGAAAAMTDRPGGIRRKDVEEIMRQIKIAGL